MKQFCSVTVRTRIFGPYAKMLELPLLVWSGTFSFSFLYWGEGFWCDFRPFLEEEIWIT